VTGDKLLELLDLVGLDLEIDGDDVHMRFLRSVLDYT
jgi:hypothetical protein